MIRLSTVYLLPIRSQFLSRSQNLLMQTKNDQPITSPQANDSRRRLPEPPNLVPHTERGSNYRR